MMSLAMWQWVLTENFNYFFLQGGDVENIAREVLWRNGLDYKHGTGHGIGHFLTIHERRLSITIKSRFLQLQIKWEPSNFNMIYSVKINYRGPNVGICSKPFNLAAAGKEIHYNQTKQIFLNRLVFTIITTFKFKSHLKYDIFYC